MNTITSPNTKFFAKKWMVVYTRSKSEKKVDQLLKMQNIESFCPTTKVRRKWADRIKTVEIPLFNSYIFVRINATEELRVLQTAGVLNFVHFCGRPAEVPVADIDRIRSIVSTYSDIEVVSAKSLKVGDTIVVKEGVLFDCQGEVLEVHEKSVLIVIKQLDCALTAKVKVEYDQLMLANTTQNRQVPVY